MFGMSWNRLNIAQWACVGECIYINYLKTPSHCQTHDCRANEPRTTSNQKPHIVYFSTLIVTLIRPIQCHLYVFIFTPNEIAHINKFWNPLSIPIDVALGGARISLNPFDRSRSNTLTLLSMHLACDVLHCARVHRPHRKSRPIQTRGPRLNWFWVLD